MLRVCYVCATVKNSPIFMKTRKYLNMKKAPKTLGFKGFSEILINFFIISLRTESPYFISILSLLCATCVLRKKLYIIH
nr:MAG TPA: hypothetical protein [Caudoviricetes sp.]